MNIIVLLLPLVFAACAVRADEKDENLDVAVFAGGCFWCMEPPFEKLDGVISVVAGYTGGNVPNPTYEQVSSGATGHAEAVRITFDRRRVSYEQLLQVFWRSINPTDPGGQFADRGSQYRTAIFYVGEAQKQAALASLKRLGESGKFDAPIATVVVPAGPFYEAEAYHQDYYRAHPGGYKSYFRGSGRENFLEETWRGAPPVWGKSYFRPDDGVLRQQLNQRQWQVTQENGTEPAFNNAYWDNKKEGIYVDIVSGEPLFSSFAKFNSGTGWPSFYEPLIPDNIVEKTDESHGMVRVEVRSRYGNSHLGHRFDDGPAPSFQRYCINSAALRFIPKERLESEGYGEFLYLFD